MVDSVKQTGNFAQHKLPKSNGSQNSGVTPISQSGGDGVDQLNSKAVVAELAQKPSIDIESVERIKSAIKGGEYPVNLDAVADELIRSYVEMKS